MVSTPGRRRQVALARTRGLSARRACALIGTARSGLRHESKRAKAVHAQHARIVDQLAPRFPKAAELLAFTAFPREHWKLIWSKSPQERLNRDAIVRLVGAALAEQSDEWLVVRRYMTFDTQATPRSSPLNRNRPAIGVCRPLRTRAMDLAGGKDGATARSSVLAAGRA